MEQINYVENELLNNNDLPSFSAGDTVTVHYKIKEGGKERTQLFKGVVIQRKGKSTTETFTVRKISSGVGVERIFPVLSPAVEKIEVNKEGSVRRARIYYLRGLTGKKARIKGKEKIIFDIQNIKPAQLCRFFCIYFSIIKNSVLRLVALPSLYHLQLKVLTLQNL